MSLSKFTVDLQLQNAMIIYNSGHQILIFLTEEYNHASARLNLRIFVFILCLLLQWIIYYYLDLTPDFHALY